jgi:hypothetical protein
VLTPIVRPEFFSSTITKALLLPFERAAYIARADTTRGSVVATFKFTADKSIYSTGLFPVFGFAPSEDTATADTFVLDPNTAFVTKNSAILFGDDGAWTATFNGTVFSQLGTAVNLLAGNKGASTFTIGVDGAIGAGNEALLLQSSATIKNSGYIGSVNDTIIITEAGTYNITNNASGRIASGLFAIVGDTGGLSTDKITNAGSIFGLVSLYGGNDSFTNSGEVNGTINLGDGNNVFSSTGTIIGSVSFGNGDDKFTNSGLITADLLTGAGKDTITNSGKGAIDFISTGDNDDTVTNSGTVQTNVVLGSGNNKLTNSGKIGGSIIGGENNDTVINSGTVASIQTDKGDDIVTNTGTVLSSILLDDGNDKFNGGAKAELVFDGNGSDTIKLGGGDDHYAATGSTGADGLDSIDGGTGIDLYNAFNSTASTLINLDSIDHEIAAYSFGLIAKNSASGAKVGNDSVKNVEDAAGSDDSGDVIYGSSVANKLSGWGGADKIAGFAGNDTIDGGEAGDTLIGGSGADTMIGGADADSFIYLALSDSGLTKATRDIISDFEAGTDTIVLTLIDANTANGSATNDGFNWMGTNKNFAGAPGELRAYWTPTGQIIEGDVNGDKKADFSIELVDPNHTITLMATDFDL